MFDASNKLSWSTEKNTPDEIFVSFLFIALGTRGIEKNIRRYRKL